MDWDEIKLVFSLRQEMDVKEAIQHVLKLRE